MKIGDFSRKFDVSTSTVRYYVESNLLTPIKKNSQYIFTENNCLEMEYILKLKKFSFSMDEIKNFLHVIRLYNLDDERVNENLKALLVQKKSILKKEALEIKKQVNLIDVEISNLINSNNNTERSQTGFSFNHLCYLTCPTCNSALNMNNLKITNGKVINGDLYCDCGYKATIENGIISTVPDNSYKDIYDFHLTRYGYEEKFNDFLFFEYSQDISNESTALLLKSYAWIDFILQSENLKNKVILVPDFSAHYLYKYIDKPYFQDALIIISGSSREFIDSIKTHLDPMKKNFDIIYIVNALHSLPIKKNSIDLWIDTISSYSYSFYHSTTLHEYLDPYMSDNAHVIGLTKALDKSSKTIKAIRQIYKDCHEDNSKKDAFINMLENLNWNLKILENIGYVSDPGEYYDYFQKGDKHYYLGYLAQK